nr:hypothetical protein [Escherichia coli]
MTETESAILAHARRCAPAESCGFVVRTPEGERYFPCVNISGEPEAYFRMSCNFAFFSGLIGAQFWAERVQPKSPELDAKLLVSC